MCQNRNEKNRQTMKSMTYLFPFSCVQPGVWQSEFAQIFVKSKILMQFLCTEAGRSFWNLPLLSKDILLLAVLLLVQGLVHMLCLRLERLHPILCMAPHIRSSACYVFRGDLSGHASVKQHCPHTPSLSVSAHYLFPSWSLSHFVIRVQNLWFLSVSFHLQA